MKYCEIVNTPFSYNRNLKQQIYFINNIFEYCSINNYLLCRANTVVKFHDCVISLDKGEYYLNDKGEYSLNDLIFYIMLEF